MFIKWFLIFQVTVKYIYNISLQEIPFTEFKRELRLELGQYYIFNFVITQAIYINIPAIYL